MTTRRRNGRFAKGNTGGPGRPKREAEADYLAAMTTGVPMKDWHAIVQRAVEDAKQGDARARDWLSRHLLGEQARVDVVHESAPQIILQVPDNGRGGLEA